MILKQAGNNALNDWQMHVVCQVTAEITLHVGVSKIAHAVDWKMLVHAQQC